MEHENGEFTEFVYIPFTRDEWETIISSLYSGGGVSITPDELNIIDRIEKSLEEPV
jgi:hypothetical protein